MLTHLARTFSFLFSNYVKPASIVHKRGVQAVNCISRKQSRQQTRSRSATRDNWSRVETKEQSVKMALGVERIDELPETLNGVWWRSTAWLNPPEHGFGPGEQDLSRLPVARSICSQGKVNHFISEWEKKTSIRWCYSYLAGDFPDSECAWCFVSGQLWITTIV